MADLYVLEGRGDIAATTRRRMQHRAPSRARMRQVPGVVYGDPLQALLGKSWLRKAASGLKSATKVAISPVTATYSVTKSVAKATVQAVKKPTLTNISKIVTNPLVRAKNETVSTVKQAGHAVMETGRAVGMAANVARRVVKRLIKTVAKKVLFHGDLLGSASAIPKNAAKGVLIPVATAAVVANTVTAPYSPLVPVLVNEVIDELYSAIEKKIKQGLSPDKAANEAQAELDRLEPGEENDPKVTFGATPWLIGGGLALLLFLVLRRRSQD